MDTSNIRRLLKLSGTQMEDIPDKMLSLAFNSKTYDRYEYIGDAVLHMITTNYMLEDESLSSYLMTRVISRVESNVTLQCMMDTLGMCSYISGSKKGKTCADVFEAILGVLYVYLYRDKRVHNAMDILHDWMDEVWLLNDVLDEAIDNPKSSGCNIVSHVQQPVYSQWSDWEPCNIEDQSIRTRTCVSGRCSTEDMVESRPCDPTTHGPWEPVGDCDSAGLQEWRSKCSRDSIFCTDQVEVRECTKWGSCEEDGYSHNRGLFTGMSYGKEKCPDNLYEEYTYNDTTCIPGDIEPTKGSFRILRRCLDPTKCVDKVEQYIPCIPGDRFISVPEFRKLPRDEQIDMLGTEADILRRQGISEKDIQGVLGKMRPGIGRDALANLHIKLFNLLRGV